MKKIIRLNLFFYLIVGALLSSCVNQKQIAYFQKEPSQPDTIAVANTYVPRIQPGDILSITVGSLNPAASSFFNPFASATTGSETSSGANNTASGFLIDANGIIELPLVGEIKVAGYTTSEARDTIKNRLKFYLKEPTVNVRFLNYKISVLGEVAHPADYVIANETITLPEALSIAGDLTILGKRNNILVVRNYNGKKEFGRVNLNNRDVFTSPYYYLHSGDLIYVEPGRAKALQSDPIIRILPIVLSSVALIVTIFFKFK